MIEASLISRVRAACPMLQGRVAGAADFVAGLKNYNTNMALPAAYVVPRTHDAGPNRSMAGLFQVVQMAWGIVVEFDATADRRGQAPVMQFDAMMKCLWGALLMWQPEECRSANGMYYLGAGFLDLDRARLFYEWTFAIDYQITDLDAVPIWELSPGQYEPLCGIEVDIHKAPLDLHPNPAAVVVLDTDPDNECEDITP